MDPDPLLPVFAPLTSLRGVGETLARLIARAAGGARVLDLLFHLPESYIDRRRRCTLAQLRPGEIATTEVEVFRVEPPGGPRQPTKIAVRDASGFGELVFFNRFPANRLLPGTRVLVSGRAGENRSFIHPDHIVPADRPELLPPVEPVWPLTAGLFAWHLKKPIAEALEKLPAFPEWHDPALLKRENWPDFTTALRALQAPHDLPDDQPRRRLAYDELLSIQVGLCLVKQRRRTRPGRALPGDRILQDQARTRFGYNLTGSQTTALAEIAADLAAPHRMLRLLQGDVGAGKTIVAALAMLQAVEAGTQAAIMAPTELLARQHLRTLERIMPVPVALLTGSVAGKARAKILADLADGTLKVVIGTHALFQDKVIFQDLGLAVIDEQHRFGVEERLRLGAKGPDVNILVMTATPIPRTILLTQWGEMDVSRLTEKPAGRLPIRTTLHSIDTMASIIDGVARMLDRGGRVYWVCPLVNESELIDLAAAENRFAELADRFAPLVGLAHGQQDSEVRESALADFVAGRTRILVATTVIEVGVDVPEATIMVIEHAERFGLAQLHQLRGRIGRGAEASFCLLLHADGLFETAKRRLVLLRDTDDGFAIADEDFRLRGGGDLLGTSQSGFGDWKLADPERDEGLLQMAARDAAVLLDRDPKLRTPRGIAIRLLLKLFGRSGRTLGSG